MPLNFFVHCILVSFLALLLFASLCPFCSLFVLLHFLLYAFVCISPLVSSHLLREVIDASPAKDKRVFLVENYPRYSDRLPDNLLEVEHSIRDIMFCDKTLHNKRLAKTITYYLEFIDELYHVIEDRFDLENIEDKEKFEKIKSKYRKISQEHGAQIKGLYYTSRDEPFPDLYENADFSIGTIKASIKEGELKNQANTKGLLQSSNKCFVDR